MSAEKTFRQKAPWMMRRLISEFTFSISDAAAIAGNAGHESLGFTKLQEMKPTVEGSRGGYGWFQWTGPRRRAYEAWCKEKKLDPASDEANYGFLAHELRTTEKRAIDATKKAKTFRDKVVAFEMAFERAGVKHYDSRVRWAEIALDAYSKAGAKPDAPVQPTSPAPSPPPQPKPDIPSPPPAAPTEPEPSGKKGIANAVLLGFGAILAALIAWLMNGG